MSLSAQDKIRVAVSVAGVEAVWEKLNEFWENTENVPGLADNMTVETDGSIYSEDTGKYLPDSILEEFVEYCEKENA